MSTALLDLDRIPYGASTIAIATYRLSQLLRGELDRTLSQYGDLSLIEWRICVGLSGPDSITQKEVVEFTRMQQAQVSRALRQLEERRLIKSTRSKEDRRSWLFSLTEKGRIHFNRNLPVVIAFCEAIDSALDPEEVAQYLEMSERIARASLQATDRLDVRNKDVA